MGEVIDFDTGKVINNKFDYFEMGKKHMLKGYDKVAFRYFIKGAEKGCDKCQLVLKIKKIKINKDNKNGK